MRKYFITGFIVLLPAAVTIGLVAFLTNILTRPFVGNIQQILTSTVFSEFELNQIHFLALISQLLAIALLVVVTFFIGILGHVYVLGFFGRWGEYLIGNIPVVSHIYRATREVVSTIFVGTHEEQRFSKVVLVPYPYEETLAMGLVPNEYLPEGTDEQHDGMIPVFLPGSPNPTLGFMMMFKREHVEFVDMSVEDALHMIISLGVVWENGTNHSNGVTEHVTES